MDIGYILTKLLALATLFGNLLVLGLLIFFVVRRSIFDGILAWLRARALWIGLIISAGSTFGSLIYS